MKLLTRSHSLDCMKILRYSKRKTSKQSGGEPTSSSLKINKDRYGISDRWNGCWTQWNYSHDPMSSLSWRLWYPHHTYIRKSWKNTHRRILFWKCLYTLKWTLRAMKLLPRSHSLDFMKNLRNSQKMTSEVGLGTPKSSSLKRNKDRYGISDLWNVGDHRGPYRFNTWGIPAKQGWVRSTLHWQTSWKNKHHGIKCRRSLYALKVTLSWMRQLPRSCYIYFMKIMRCSQKKTSKVDLVGT